MNDTTQQCNEIDTYQAGRDLDILIAKEVFGIEAKENSAWGLGYWLQAEGSPTYYRLPPYSTADGAALEIVKYLCRDGREQGELYFKMNYGFWETRSHFSLVMAMFNDRWDSSPLYQGIADTIALAICRAALRVVREDLSLPEASK